MTALRWVAALVAVECLVILAIIPRSPASAVIAGLFFICFATVCWTVAPSKGHTND
ncbi:hypothetical protein [Microbacterium sp. NPDC057944]|uniref:hypothetical protein n=1 Tax=Microbacterium sp. NPDC057944 TaxID=3346286 RepID=UPI0036DF81D8